MIVKKLKYNLDDDKETIVKISMDKYGLFSADIPMIVRSVCNDVVTKEPTLMDAVRKVESLIYFYRQQKTQTEHVILLNFRRKRQPFINDGIHFGLNYLIAEKTTFGEIIRYVLARIEHGKILRVGNSIDQYDKDALSLDDCVEMKFDFDTYNEIKSLHDKLENLCTALEKFTKDETQLRQLLGSQTKLLK